MGKFNGDVRGTFFYSEIGGVQERIAIDRGTGGYNSGV